MERYAKQVIVMRTDLGMRKGKMIAQGAHASVAWLSNGLTRVHVAPGPHREPGWTTANITLNQAEDAWLTGDFTKVCVRVDSEEELFAVEKAAIYAHIQCNLITDAGKTEFHGVPTVTCLAIGPDWADVIDEITGHLKLL